MINITPEIDYIIELLKCAVTDNVPSVPSEKINWDKVFKLGVRHKICSTLYFGLQKLPESVQKSIGHFPKYQFAYQQNLVADANRAFEIQNLKPDFQSNHIDFIFLKGSVTKYLYPDTSMRTMNDIDIYYRGVDLKTVISVFKKHGYEITKKEPKEIGFFKKINKIKIEMQTQLVDDGYEVWADYLKDGWNQYEKISNSTEYRMSSEDFYIYHIIHMAKHFKNGGIGLIHVLDTWILSNSNINMDTSYVHEELNKIGLETFESNVRILLKCWFEDFVPDENTAETITMMTKYFFRSGAFGTKTQQETNHIIENGQTKLSMIQKIFPNQKTMVNYYGNALKKYPFLIPFYWIRLNFTRLFITRKRSKKSFVVLNKITDERIRDTKELMKRCGL